MHGRASSRHHNCRAQAVRPGDGRLIDWWARHMKNIRNFSIIAHIDHGKTTLSDRLMERTGALTSREMSEQFLDSMDLERERGITIKQHSVRLEYKAKNGEDYILNLIDTPGHVDFAYEVSRSLAACQGALLVVDASQGVEAQTLANAHLAVDAGLEIVPVINKIDLPGRGAGEGARADRERHRHRRLGGHPRLRQAGHRHRRDPGGDRPSHAAAAGRSRPRPCAALVFDSWFDQYRGVVILVHVVDGELKPGMKVRLMASGGSYLVENVGVFTPKPMPVAQLAAGEVGFVVAGIKTVSDVAIGDTLTDDRKPAPEALPGFKEIKPMVFAGLYPVDADQYAELRDALREAAPQRRVVLLRAGDLNRSRLRLPLRVPRPAAHGDRAGAAGARVLAEPARHRALRALSHPQDQRRGPRDRLPGQAARSRLHRVHGGADHHRDHPHQRGVRGPDPEALPGEARDPEGARTTSRPRA